MKPTFGETIRANRLGFRAMQGVPYWLRISTDGPPHLIEVVRFGNLRELKPGQHHYHVKWWEGDQEYLQGIVKNVLWRIDPTGEVSLLTFHLDDDGKEVTA